MHVAAVCKSKDTMGAQDFSSPSQVRAIIFMQTCFSGRETVSAPCIKSTNQLLFCVGLVEINTVFVIARRYFNRTGHGGRIYNWCHWGTFIPFRFIMYPYLIGVFWYTLEGFPLWKKGWVCGLQAFLCVFNAMFLHTILTKHKVYDSIRTVLSFGDLKTVVPDA